MTANLAGTHRAFAAPQTHASTGRTTQLNAFQAIPFDQMDANVQRKLHTVASRPSLFRRMPVQTMQCDPNLYMFLVNYPEVVINMWQLMGVSKVQIERLNARMWRANDGAGTTATVEVVYSSPQMHVMYAEGMYDGPLITRPVQGRCVLALQTGYSQQGAEGSLITHQLDVFLQVDHVGAELVAKTLHPLMGRTADHNFAETSKFVGMVSKAAEDNGPGMEGLASKLTNVRPEIREHFAELAAAVSYKAILREAQPAGFELSSPLPESGVATLSTSGMPAHGATSYAPQIWPNRRGELKLRR